MMARPHWSFYEWLGIGAVTFATSFISLTGWAYLHG